MMRNTVTTLLAASLLAMPTLARAQAPRTQGRGTQVQFLGPVLPQPGVLQRLVENLCAVALPPQVVPEAGQALLQRVQGAAKT